MQLKLMVFCMLLTSFLQASPIEEEDDMEYPAGPFLIYDCDKRHFICVQENEKMNCEERRNKARHERKLNLGCAPIGSLPTIKACEQRQLFMVSQNYGKRFCIGDDWKEKEVKF